MFDERDPMAKASAQGTELEQYFTGDGVGPISFPELKPTQYLICMYRDSSGEEPKFAVVTDLDEMVEWFNAAKYNWAEIDNWYITELDLSN